VGYVSNPEFTGRGNRRERLSCSPDRIVIGAFRPRTATRSPALHAGDRRADRAAATSRRRDDQARGECRSDDADLVHQRDRERLRGDRGGTSSAVAEGIGLDRRIGPSFLRAGIGFGGSCFPEGLARR
jgi:UDPglucose 6-dehydrogenase